jgi:hypothetical protein
LASTPQPISGLYLLTKHRYDYMYVYSGNNPWP